MEEEEVEEIKQNIQSLTDTFATKIKNIEKQPTKISWLYSGLFTRSPNKAKLFNHEYCETKVLTKFEEFHFSQIIYVQQISIYSTNAAAKLAVEILYSDSTVWNTVSFTKDNGNEYIFAILNKSVTAIRVKSLKKDGNRLRTETITAIHIFGCPLQTLYTRAKNINEKIEQLSKIEKTLIAIREYYDELKPSIKNLEADKEKIEDNITKLSLSEEQKNKVFNDFTKQQGDTIALQQKSKNLQEDIVDKQRELSQLRSEASQFSPDLRGHNETIKKHGWIFIGITVFASLILGLLLWRVVYPELNTVYNTYLVNVAADKDIDYMALISLKAFYGIFGLVILIGIEEVARRSLKAALHLMDESREINATNVLVNTLVESAGNEANLTPEQVFNEQIKAKMQAFQGTRYRYLQKLDIKKKGLADTPK